MSMKLPPRLDLARRPTPLQEFPRLSEAWGGPRIWIKRDDLTGFGLSGNKVRKLEFHLAAARSRGADAVVTCGAVQSNHCRAAAVACARLGWRAVLLLRTADGQPPAGETGNHRISRMAGAEVRYVTPDQYRERDVLMVEAAGELSAAGRIPWLIPEGASDRLGMWGTALAYQEMIDQTVVIEGRIAEVWHAASSGGTTAGFGWAAHRAGFGVPQVALSVGETADGLRERVETIWAEASAGPSGGPGEPEGAVKRPDPVMEYMDRYAGEGYGAVSGEQREATEEAVRLTGLLFDPVYTGKALFGLRREIEDGRFRPEDNVVFWHTGGGFAALA